MSQRWSAAGLFRLVVILVGFPVFFVVLAPQLDFVAAFFRGDRSQWLPFWAAGAAFEWAVLILVLMTYLRQREALAEIGLPRPGAGTLLLAIFLVGAAAWAAVALPGMSPEALAQQRHGGAMFLPPADMGSRLFWVFMSFTAAFCEEILFRGVAITELRRLTGTLWVAVPVSALVFAFYHGGLEQGPVAFGVRFALALVLSGLFLWRKRLTSAMAVHFLLDASALLAR